MKHITYINRTALLSLLSLGLGASAVQAEEELPIPAEVQETIKPLFRPMPPEEKPFHLQLKAVAARERVIHPPQPNAEPEVFPNPDPFAEDDVATKSKTDKDQGAERLDAQARILFARGETDKAIALQTQAVEKAKETALKFAETLARYDGRPVEMLDMRAKQITQKLENIIIPKIDFEKTTLDEAVGFLREQAEKLDAAEADPTKKGLNFVIPAAVAITADPFADGKSGSPVIASLKLRNVPLGIALKYICKLTQHRFSVDNYAVTLEPSPAP